MQSRSGVLSTFEEGCTRNKTVAMDPFTTNVVFFGLILMIFYFFFIRPQAKRQREQQRFVSELKKGDRVVTSSGIIGKVNKVEPHIVELQIDNKTFVRVLRSTVSKEMTDALKEAEKGKS